MNLVSNLLPHSSSKFNKKEILFIDHQLVFLVLRCLFVSFIKKKKKKIYHNPSSVKKLFLNENRSNHREQKNSNSSNFELHYLSEQILYKFYRMLINENNESQRLGQRSSGKFIESRFIRNQISRLVSY